MRKTAFIFLALVALVLASCSKDAKINRTIQGDWKTVSIAGVALEAGESLIWTFNKEDKLTGSGTTTYTFAGVSYTDAFTYSVADQKITAVVDGEAEVLSVTKYEKDEVNLVDADGYVYVLEPK